MRGIAEVAECVALDVADHDGRDRASARRTTSTSSWSGPRRRWSPGSPTISRAAGDQRVRAVAGGGAARRLQRLHQGSLRRIRHPHRGLSPLRRRGRGQGLCGRRRALPIVVKADGLAAGKGVSIAADARARPRRRSRTASPAPSAPPAPRSSSRSSSRARRRASSRWSTARTRCRWPPRRITSAPSTATRAPTPAAWAPIRRRRS